MQGLLAGALGRFLPGPVCCPTLQGADGAERAQGTLPGEAMCSSPPTRSAREGAQPQEEEEEEKWEQEAEWKAGWKGRSRKAGGASSGML